MKNNVQSFLLILVLMSPGMAGAADMIATAPVPNEQARRSDDLGQSSTATEPNPVPDFTEKVTVEVETSPVPNEQARRSDDLGQSSTATDDQIKTYGELLAAIRGVRAESQERVETAVEQERVREAWETGKLIDKYVLQNKKRAEYGKQILLRLSKDLGTSRTELSFMLQFARAYPIFPHAKILTWSDYRELLSINDAEEMKALAEQAALNQWSRTELREAVRKSKGTSQNEPAKLQAIEPGPLDTYGIVLLEDSLKIDLGFNIYRDLPDADAHSFKAGDIVTSVEDADGHYTLKSVPSPHPLPEGEEKGEGDQPQLYSSVRAVKSSTDGTEGIEPSYTYKAEVQNVVDGDTFHALIDLGFGTTLAQRVRLRRVNAPEIVSADGKEAKDLLEKILFRDKGQIILQSSKLDQYGRPIADVWVLGKPIDQELIEQGLAIRVRS